MILFLPLLLAIADPSLGTAAEPLVVDPKPGFIEWAQLVVSIFLGGLTLAAVVVSNKAANQATAQANVSSTQLAILQEQHALELTALYSASIPAIEETTARLTPIHDVIRFSQTITERANRSILQPQVSEFLRLREVESADAEYKSRAFVDLLCMELTRRRLAVEENTALDQAIAPTSNSVASTRSPACILAVDALAQAFRQLKKAATDVDSCILLPGYTSEVSEACAALVRARQDLIDASTKAVAALEQARAYQTLALARLSAFSGGGAPPS